MPAFALEDDVQHSLRAKLWHHSLKRPCVGTFFHFRLVQDSGDVNVFVGQFLLCVVTGDVAILGRLLPANGQVCSRGPVPPASQAGSDAFRQRGRSCTKFRQLGRPSSRVPLFGLRHANHDLPSLFTFLVCRQFAIDPGSVGLGEPVALEKADGVCTGLVGS